MMEHALLALLTVFAMEQIHPAVRTSAEAAYKQFGAEKAINEYVEEWQSKNVPQSLKIILGNALFVGKSITEQRVVFTINY